jgi:Icc-related predicted phosphoesterase
MYLEGMKIDTISDTHGKHKKIILPGGDILICSGDISGSGELGEVLAFLNWFADQDYRYLVMIAGNHDFIFQENPELMAEECKKRNIIYLNDSGVEIEGIKFWGSPIQPWFHDWAFNRGRGPEIKKHWDLIPEDTEVLITHGPPYLILDGVPRAGGWEENVGCQDLYDRIIQTKIKLHVFGHIHEGAGYRYFEGRTYVNASSLDGMYMFETPGYRRVVRDIAGEYFVETEVA